MNKNLFSDPNRNQEKIKSQFKPGQNKLFFLCSSSDVGVMRNLGKNGSAFGPKVILNQFKELHFHQEQSFKLAEVSSQTLEFENFDEAQLLESQKIAEILKTQSSQHFVHLGGGHDHIYTLLKALELKGYKKIGVINIDPHADTRVSETNHSGTPFRQFAQEFKNEFHLIQYGLKALANGQSTLSKIKTKQTILWHEELANETKHFEQLPAVLNKVAKEYQSTDAILVLSLDCDSVESSTMSAVSAVAHDGIPTHHINMMFDWFQKLDNKNKITGIYEYNPLFDNLGSRGARFIAQLIYRLL
ncbi:MAG: arginase family protein [Bacteriovoracaceae bacterium]|nr:arginase family protein [Bacteriovoracaceae bacterium]